MARARSALLALRKQLGDSPRPICLIDSERRIQYANKALESWTGVDQEDLIGLQCHYHWEHADESESRAAAALAPPPECFAGQQATRTVTLAGTEMRHRRATFLPLETDGEPATVLVILDANDCSPAEAAATNETSESARLHHSLARFRSHIGSLYELHQLVGEHPAIERAREQIRAAAISRARVVVQGPPGSGREHVARTVFYMQSPSRAGALVPLSCSLLDAELLKTTIAAFIHTKPEIEVTGPASLLLLDVDELSPDAQTSLMAVLNIEELQAHAIATSSRSLTDLVRSGTFRADLAHYLSTMVIELPPLVERKDDIPLLAQKFLEHANAQSARQLSGWTEAAMDLLVRYAWPGNADELSQLVRETCRRAAGPRIGIEDLPSRLREIDRAAAHQRPDTEPINLEQLLERLERETLQRAMRIAKNNRARAAKLLGISRAKLLRRMSQLGIGKDGSG